MNGDELSLSTIKETKTKTRKTLALTNLYISVTV